MARINVTKTFLPPLPEYEAYLQKIWDSNQLTNQGPLLHKLEDELKRFLRVKDFHFVANGTLALQLAIRSLDIPHGSEIITTPFSYVATTSAILWERCKPVFVDIEPKTFCLDASKIEAAVTPETSAILAVHVFGNPCDVETIGKIAKKHKLKVIYDAAHAFGVDYMGKSLLSFGDISICSFHSTKVFHTIEGGSITARDPDVSKQLELRKHFGHRGDEHYMLGINAKASEFQAAMGLTNLKYHEQNVKARKRVTGWYNKLLDKRFKRPRRPAGMVYNYAYYPIVLDSEATLLQKLKDLAEHSIFPRRYFYPSLNILPYLEKTTTCPVSEDIAERILCLPLYPDLEKDIVIKIAEVLNA